MDCFVRAIKLGEADAGAIVTMAITDPNLRGGPPRNFDDGGMSRRIPDY
jgi:hypothetical protein